MSGSNVADQPAAGDGAEGQRARALAVEHAAGMQQAAEHRQELVGLHFGRIADADDPVRQLGGGADMDRLTVQGRAMTVPAHEGLAPRRCGDEAHLEPALRHERNRDAPGAHAVDEGLRAVDRVDDPDSRRPAQVASTGLLAEEVVLGKGRLEPVTDQDLGVEIRLARHVLLALALDGQRAKFLEVAKRESTGLVDQSPGESEARVEGGLVHGQVSFVVCGPSLRSPRRGRLQGSCIVRASAHALTLSLQSKLA